MFSCPVFVFVPVFFLGSREKERDLEKKKISLRFLYIILFLSLSLSYFLSSSLEIPVSGPSLPIYAIENPRKQMNDVNREKKNKRTSLMTEQFPYFTVTFLLFFVNQPFSLHIHP